MTDDQAMAQTDWIDVQLPIRPHSDDWVDVVFFDEFHFGIGPQVTKKMKRKKGKE